jgi:TonB family protein
MSRDVNTPLVLWICAAVCAHFLLGEGGDTVAQFHEDRVAIASMGEKVRERIRFEGQTFEVSSIEGPTSEAQPPPSPKPPDPPPPTPEAKKPELVKPEIKPLVKPPEPVKEKTKKVAVVAVPDDPAKKLDPPPEADRRIAVRQHVQPNQADNPTAHFIGDEANHVDKETVSTQTSHDQDDPNPTPGGNHTGPNQNMGDSDQTKIAESEEHSGDKNRAPGEHGTEFDIQPLPPSQRPQGSITLPGAVSTQVPRGGGDGRQPTPSAEPSQQTPGGAGQASPEVWSVAEGGGFIFNPMRPNSGNTPSTQQGPGDANTPNASPSVSSTSWLGLGGKVGPGQANLNLTQTGVVASVGQDQLRKEREADGERRKSQHRGSWTASNFERWRSAIENYVSSVKPGNQTALNTAAVPFATYLNGMHNRIHPIFADSFLGSLDALPKDNPLNDQKLITRLEIVVTKDGHLVRMGVVKTSGVTAFDIAALDSVQRASPFGPAPSAIVSPDGRVYLHWEFHRDEVFACSTMNARPFMLNVPARGTPTEPSPTTPTNPGPLTPPLERGTPPPPANVNETREGLLPPPVLLTKSPA